jgi:hypothetical protein
MANGTSMRRKMETRLSKVKRQTKTANLMSLGSMRGARKYKSGNINLWNMVTL